MGLGVVSGAVTLLGDFISADAVLPARYSFLPPVAMAEHVMHELGPDANARIRSHRILVVGEAFGYGTGRESPARALRAAGVQAVLGASFSRMFYRNAVNNGVLVLDCPDLVGCGIAEDDVIDIDLQACEVRWKSRSFAIAAVPAIVRSIVEAGDLIALGRKIVESGRDAG